jgi:hypothetical protein
MLGSADQALAHSPKLPARPVPIAFPFAVADFDGDNRPDLATVQPGVSSATRYWIHFQLSGGSRQAIGLTAPEGGLRIASSDVNGDNFPDLVVTTALLREPVAVLLNDGHGNFALREPAGFPASIWGTETIWISDGAEIKDALAAILLRNFSGTCASNLRESCAKGSEKFSSALSILFCDKAPAFSRFGRAPPALSSLRLIL